MIDPPSEENKIGGGLSEEARYNLLKGWAKETGVLGLENVEFPVGFTDEYSEADKNFEFTGVKARRDIGHRKSIIAVPFNMLISIRTFEEEEPELYAYLIKECPDLFNEKDQIDYEQLLMAFFLMHEYTKGKASKWYPFIASLP